MEKLINAFEQQEKIMQYLRDITDGKMTFLPSSSSETSNKYNSDYGSVSNNVMGYIEYQKELLKTCVQQLEENRIELSNLKSFINEDIYFKEITENGDSYIAVFDKETLNKMKELFYDQAFSFETTVCACGKNCTCQCGK